MTTADALPAVAADTRRFPTYGRARLWLGISAVGTMVTLAAGALVFDAAGALVRVIPNPVGALAAFVALYAAAHLPFDILGGFVLPRRHGRAHPAPVRFAAILLRGVALHATLLFACACALLIAGRVGGVALTIATGVAISLLLLAGQGVVARALAALRPGPLDGEAGRTPTLVHADDEGFTGSITGVLRVRRILMPARWRSALGDEGFSLALRRREIAIDSGAWLRGRIVAIAFTSIGLAVSAVLAGAPLMGEAEGVIRMALFFTLWSFLGLLTLPTVSRRAVVEIDRRLRASATDVGAIDAMVSRLDALQDGEPERPGFVEAIFHPVPSVRNRLGAPEGDRSRGAQSRGAWNAARTSVYLSAAGVGLLGRAVHCNCGRPALWVYLPTD
jgi:hypothetical protein